MRRLVRALALWAILAAATAPTPAPTTAPAALAFVALAFAVRLTLFPSFAPMLLDGFDLLLGFFFLFFFDDLADRLLVVLDERCRRR